MIQQDDNLEKVFNKLTLRLEEFIDQVREKDGKLMATDQWTVDDILRHVTFWHGNYADNYKALAVGTPPPLLKGLLHKINMEGVHSLQHLDRNQLIRSLKDAHMSLQDSVLKKKIQIMKYRAQGPVYTSQKFLEAVESHLQAHISQIRKAR